MDYLNNYGWRTYLNDHTQISDELQYGRIITVHKTNYKIVCQSGVKTAELVGQLLYSSEPDELPQTGDWVEIADFDDQALITRVLPRTTILSRKLPGRTSQTQVLAANVNTAMIVQGLNRDFNINRLERMALALLDAKIKTVVILNKTDLSPQWQEQFEQVKERLHNTTVIAVSALQSIGLEKIADLLQPQHTYVLLGSSGAGKSTLLNALMNKEIQATKALSEAVGKGRHTTTSRDLILLDNGSMIIDSPGVREFALALDDLESIHLSFDDIEQLSVNCRYKDCTHTSEPGCAILDALAKGDLDDDVYSSYLKLRDEANYFQSTVKEKKRKGKQLAKLIKNMKNQNMKKRYL